MNLEATIFSSVQSEIDLMTADDSYSARWDGLHDDLVFATALACWWGRNRPVRPMIPLLVVRR
jgi:hypothetical protein